MWVGGHPLCLLPILRHPCPNPACPEMVPVPWASKNSSSELFSESRAMFCIRHSDRL